MGGRPAGPTAGARGTFAPDWIFTELAMVGYSVLQTVYVAIGLLVLVLVPLLLGVAPVRRGRPA